MLLRFILVVSIITEILIIIAVASPWISCNEKPHKKHYGLWKAGNVTENPAIFFTMVGLRPVAVLWLLSSSAALVGFAVQLKAKIDNNRERIKWARRISNTLTIFQVVASFATMISHWLEMSSIQIGRDCHYFRMGSGTAIFALIIGVVGQAASTWCDRWVIVDEGPSPRRISEAESQGIEETVINGSNGAETQEPQITDS